MKELKINTNNIMVTQYDIEKVLNEIIAVLNGKYKISNFFVMSNDSRTIQILKPKFEYFRYSENEIPIYKKLWELKIGYIKIIREV